MYNFIKQLEEKNVKHEITHMVWSDRMDLVAFSNIKGEVALHRLTWSRAWILNPPMEGVTVKGIVWRPDGKILAIAYSSGEICLVEVEHKNILNTSRADGDISCMTWVQEKVEIDTNSKYQNFEEDDENKYMKDMDFSSIFLSEPTPLPSTNVEETPNKNFLHNQNLFNILLIGTKSGLVYISIFGCFTCAVLDINELGGFKCSIENIHVIEDMSTILVTVKDNENNIKILGLNSDILRTYMPEIYTLAMKTVYIMDLLSYLTDAITNIVESWETILLEIDTKLAKFAAIVPKGGVTADFLDLLMFGICSSEMEMFLLYDLTKKGLEKFGQSIEMSYVNIQKLLLKNVTKFGQNITYHLAEIRGMARFEHRYKILGLAEEIITEGISANGAFLIKTGEMQQIINHSLSNYRAFFRWLYTAIMHLIDEPIPSDIHKMTQQDLAYITEFLQNFDDIGHLPTEEVQKGFIMERIGQYLTDDSLSIPPNMENNDWTNFLKQNECIRNHTYILKHFEKMSLIQQFKELKNTLNMVLQWPKVTISQQFTCERIVNAFNFGPEPLRMSVMNMNEDIAMYSFIGSKNRIYFLQVFVDNYKVKHGRCGKFYFTNLSPDGSEGDNLYQIIDNQFFSPNTLSLLLQDNKNNKTAILYQFYLTEAFEKLTDVNLKHDIDRNNYLPDMNATVQFSKGMKPITGMVASQFAISGSRKVGIVLSENKKKIRLFELGTEEDDEDEDEDMTNRTMRESDVSMQDNSIVV